MAPVMKKPLQLLAACAAVLLASCASTPQKRIDNNPQMFNALSSKDRSLVSRGVIREGMNRDAVFLAWGAPDQTTMGRKNGRQTEQWAYMGQRPVRTMSMGFGMGYGYGGFGPWGYGGGPWGYGPWGYGPWGYGGPGWNSNVVYVPYTAGTVGFTNGRVTEWQAAK